MKKFLLVSAAVVALSSSIFADAIWSGSTGTLVSIPTTSSWPTATYTGNPISTNTQAPFWNNPSSDTIASHVANVGDVLAGLTTGTNLIGTNLSSVGGNINGSYYALTANDNTAGGGDPETAASGTSASPGLAFSMISNASAYNVAVLFADSSLNLPTAVVPTVFGYYYGSGVGIQLHQLGSISNNVTGAPASLASNVQFDSNGAVYGFYATACYLVVSGNCTGSVTYTSGAGNFSNNLPSGSSFLGSLGLQHFALFQLADGEYVLGFEDYPGVLGGGGATEGIGDFNDVIIGITSAAVPEPGTIGIMGLGLAALGFLGRRRFAKK